MVFSDFTGNGDFVITPVTGRRGERDEIVFSDFTGTVDYLISLVTDQ